MLRQATLGQGKASSYLCTCVDVKAAEDGCFANIDDLHLMRIVAVGSAQFFNLGSASVLLKKRRTNAY